MTHDKFCSRHYQASERCSCVEIRNIREDERRKAANKLLDMAVVYPVMAYVFQQAFDVVLDIRDIKGNLIDGEPE